jgi:hypothetical protein
MFAGVVELQDGLAILQLVASTPATPPLSGDVSGTL